MIYRLTNLLLTITAALFLFGELAQAAPKIVDYQRHVPRKYKTKKRQSTKYIIVHSTEAGLSSSLRSLAKRGHTNYLVARNGTVYRIVHKNYRANHAGRSMWSGQTSISNHSIGIELVGYHNDPFTKDQYKSLKWLIETFQKQYKIPDRHVLEHYRVAYGVANRWVKKSHRGRKKDPGVFNFDRKKAGLTSKDKRNSIFYDPDVAAGRLLADPDVNVARLRNSDRKQYQVQVAAVSTDVITSRNTAWDIARGEFDSPLTLYKYPNGKTLRGDQVKNWQKMPAGTKVYLNREETEPAGPSPLKQITRGLTAYDLVGIAYKRSDTYYIFPKGTVKSGRQVKGWSRIPPGTHVLASYNKPEALTNKSRKKASVLEAAKAPDTVFLIPKSRPIAASDIEDVSSVPSGTLIFTKK
jgi:N-acetylmuramoyl-L-alanine amidase